MREIKLDLRDRKILVELDFNARELISRIARKVRISKEVALYRIRKLEKEEVIKQYYAIINPSKLGYYYCRLLVKFQNTTKEIEENIINDIGGNPKIAYLGVLDGSWDLLIGYWARNMIEFEEFIDNFVLKYGKCILEKEVSIGMHLSQFNYRFLLEQENVKEFKTGGEVETPKIDDIDTKLLILLTKKGRINFEELSRELNLTGKAISYRIKNLIRKKIIVGFRTLIDYKKFGYSNNKVLIYLQNLTKEDFSKLNNYLKIIPNCIYITKQIGKSDLEFEILTKNREEFFSIIKEIRERFRNRIRNYYYFIIHKEPISRFIPIQ